MLEAWTAYLILPSNSRFPFTARKDQHLIHSMHLIANIPSDRNLHRHKLAEKPRVQDFSELPESSDIRSEFWEVLHFVFGWGGRHFWIFAV